MEEPISQSSAYTEHDRSREKQGLWTALDGCLHIYQNKSNLYYIGSYGFHREFSSVIYIYTLNKFVIGHKSIYFQEKKKYTR